MSRTRAELLIERIAVRREPWLEGWDKVEADPDDAQAVLVEASVAGQVAAGPRVGRRVRRSRLPMGEEVASARRGVSYEGYGLHAATTVGAHRRDALERLVRYALRGPLAKGRLEARDDGRLMWHLRRP